MMFKHGVAMEESCFCPVVTVLCVHGAFMEYIETGPHHLQARDKLEFQTCSYLQVMGCLAYNYSIFICRFGLCSLLELESAVEVFS